MAVVAALLVGCVPSIVLPADESLPPAAEELQVPARFTIIPDDWQAEYVGRLPDGRQYFVSADFVVETSNVYVSVYYWNADGTFDEAEIEPLGDDSVDAVEAALTQRKSLLKGATTESITVAPFTVDHDGVSFGFIARGPDDEFYEVASVSHVPNYDMVYYWPWDGEGYDT